MTERGAPTRPRPVALVEPAPRHRPPRPVFLDSSGGRRRLLRLVGTVGGCVLFAALALLGLGLSGASPVHLPGLPDAHRSAAPRPSEVTRKPPSAPVGVGPQSSQGSTGVTATPTRTTTTTPAPTTTTKRHVPTQTPPHPTKSR